MFPETSVVMSSCFIRADFTDSNQTSFWVFIFTFYIMSSPVSFLMFVKQYVFYCSIFRYITIETEVCCIDIESSSKEGNVLRLPSERYSPVRRLSDGLTMIRKYRSQLEKIYRKALQNQVPVMHFTMTTADTTAAATPRPQMCRSSQLRCCWYWYVPEGLAGLS